MGVRPVFSDGRKQRGAGRMGDEKKIITPPSSTVVSSFVDCFAARNQIGKPAVLSFRPVLLAMP